jgi:phosphatidylglycerol lysyltransferase
VSSHEQERQRVLDLLRSHGRNTCSFLALESDLQYWFHGDDACVAYADTGAAWVVAGEPIAAPEEMIATIEAFCDHARGRGRRVRYFGLESEEVPLSTLRIGEQPRWNPQHWHEILAGKKSLREQLRRARAKKVQVRSVSAAEIDDGACATRSKVDTMVQRWIDSKALAPMGFLVKLDLFHLPEERIFLVAERGDRIVGLLAAVPVFARGGWFFEDVLRDPEAPNGTIELLIDTAMREVAERGCTSVTYGLAPLANVDSKWLRRIRDHSRWLYDFEGLRAFKAKLQPHSWEPVYLGFPTGERGLSAIIDSLAAFANGSFLRFGWHTLLHQAKFIAAILAVLLIPWSALLALAPADEWFPSPAIRTGWLVYDAVLFLGLTYLAQHWRPALAVFLALAAAVDCALGIAQLLMFNAQRLDNALDWLPAAAALIAPAFAAIFLWAARHRGRRA